MSGEMTGGGEMQSAPTEMPTMAEPMGVTELAVLAEPAGASELVALSEPVSGGDAAGEQAGIEPPGGDPADGVALLSEPGDGTAVAEPAADTAPAPGETNEPPAVVDSGEAAAEAGDPMFRETGPEGVDQAQPTEPAPDAVEANVQQAAPEQPAGEAAERAEVWEMDARDRGVKIENDLAQTEYKDWFHCGKEHGGTQEHIDFFKDGVGVSLKTVGNPNEASMREMQAEVDALERSGIEHSTDDGATWTKTELALNVRVPEGREDGFPGLEAYGAQRGINVTVRPY